MNKLQLDYKTTLVLVTVLAIAGALLADVVICKNQSGSFLYVPLQSSSQVSLYSNSKTVLYIFIQRLKQFILLLLLFRVCNPHIVIRVLIWLLSMLFGACISCQYYETGFTGVIWFLLCLIPHYVLYLWGIVTMYKYFTTRERNENAYIYFILIVAFMVTGVLAEGIISRFFLKNFLQYMGM